MMKENIPPKNLPEGFFELGEFKGRSYHREALAMYYNILDMNYPENAHVPSAAKLLLDDPLNRRRCIHERFCFEEFLERKIHK
jgi:hypothetical protein